MTPNEYLQCLRAEHEQADIWLKAASSLYTLAADIQNQDMMLATMARRIALAIEQYENEVLLKLTEITSLHQQETEQVVSDLFDRLQKKK